MIEVTKEQFFRVIGPMDVHPKSERDFSSWETRDRDVVGRTTPGYMCRDENGKHTSCNRYFLQERFTEAIQ